MESEIDHPTAQMRVGVTQRTLVSGLCFVSGWNNVSRDPPTLCDVDTPDERHSVNLKMQTPGAHALPAWVAHLPSVAESCSVDLLHEVLLQLGVTSFCDSPVCS